VPFDLITMGRVGVDLYPATSGPLASVERFNRSLGGTATNVAVAAARLGQRAAVITAVGADAFGGYVRGALEAFGVDARFVAERDNLPTPVVFAELDPPEDPTIVFYRYPVAPDMTLTAADVDLDAVRAARIFWATGTGLSAEPSRTTTLAALAARDRAHPTVLDLDYRPQLWADPAEAGARYGQALPLVTVAIGNRAEVQAAVGTSDPDAAADALLGLGIELAVVKKGADGVLVATAAERTTVAARRVEVVNGLGAGDAFGGALCHGLLEGWDPVRAVEYANAAGAIVVTRLACADDMPTDAEIRSFLESP